MTSFQPGFINLANKGTFLSFLKLAIETRCKFVLPLWVSKTQKSKMVIKTDSSTNLDAKALGCPTKSHLFLASSKIIDCLSTSLAYWIEILWIICCQEYIKQFLCSYVNVHICNPVKDRNKFGNIFAMLWLPPISGIKLIISAAQADILNMKSFLKSPLNFHWFGIY